MSTEKNAVGRPRAYKTVEELQIVIDKYFKDCEGKPLTDSNNEIVYDKKGNPFIVGVKVPTITGLALALGFTTRQALINYQERDEFVDTITRAKLIIEEATSQMLYTRDGSNGAKFVLSNNYKGWADKVALENAEDKAFKISVEYVENE